MAEIIKKRNPVVAGLLSLVFIGMGQLYNGQLRRALIFFSISALPTIFIFTVSSNFFSSQAIIGAYLCVLIIPGIIIFSVVDAVIAARRIGELKLRRYNRWYVYLAIMAVVMNIDIKFQTLASDAYSIPSGAMMPTLLIGDYLLADKSAYLNQTPERGDVVVFKKPSNNKINYIKRIVGLPGDRIQMRLGILHINDKPVKRQRAGVHAVVNAQGKLDEIPRYIEILPNGRHHYILEENDVGPVDNTPVYTVPEGHVFGLGDNRDHSQDSRYLNAVGFIPWENLIGQAKVLYFSLEGTATWWHIWRYPEALRFDRIGRTIN